SRIGLAGQYAAVDEGLTGRQNLEMFGRLFHLGNRGARLRAGELLERFDLVEAAGRSAREYSGGMRRRLDLAASMILSPDVLFLDEPTTGLDPRSRDEVWETVRGLVAGGTTVLLTTQYLEEADRLASHITVIDRGRAIADDRRMTRSSEAVLRRAGWGAPSVRAFIGHQANQRILDSVGDRLGIAPAHRYGNIRELGNTAAASVPLVLADPAVHRAVVPGERTLLTAFGGGFTWASTALTWPDVTPLTEEPDTGQPTEHADKGPPADHADTGPPTEEPNTGPSAEEPDAARVSTATSALAPAFVPSSPL
ncbi:3-oxoacyl-[acyl-carrier-protein] synthase III C-terminal domain-containing protein, partial [Streptomyces rubiginosohelvolus]|uniref:3-oxoacyl-[acyl-carrier-protein] synthase III C-terminal domain-containing protein n=1 Tax=Streptomyces rubiginosohelvolus TaxID=67362 RepID=UPI0034110F2F